MLYQQCHTSSKIMLVNVISFDKNNQKNLSAGVAYQQQQNQGSKCDFMDYSWVN